MASTVYIILLQTIQFVQSKSSFGRYQQELIEIPDCIPLRLGKCSGGYDVDETDPWMFYDHPDAIDVPVKAGQLLIADVRLLHGTYPNNTSERLTLLLGRFYRKAVTAPDDWEGQIPVEILNRDPEATIEINRNPSQYLR